MAVTITVSPMLIPETRRESGRVLVLIPGRMNYFYNQCGRRLAAALEEVGLHTDMTTLETVPDCDYDFCLISNVDETLNSPQFTSRVKASECLARVRARVRRLICVAMECARTEWFGHNHRSADEVGADLLLDIGFVDQSDHIQECHHTPYRFAFSGLTNAEAEHIGQGFDDCARVIPWTFIGHATYNRAALADQLVQTVDPRGLVYLPYPGTPVTETGSPHINQEQYETILGKARFQVWNSHHPYLYMEDQRIRMSLLTGSVPVKVVESLADVPDDLPMRYLLTDLRDLRTHMAPERFAATRRRLIQDYLRLPRLSGELVRILFPERIPIRTAA